MTATAAEIVDLAFALAGRAVAEDYAALLWQGLRGSMPALERGVGVHPLAGTSPGQDELYLTRRSRLLLRLPADFVEPAKALCGARLDLGRGPVEIGAATTVRALAPARDLYSPFVHTGAAAEEVFLAECQRLLEDIGITTRLVVGRARSLNVEGRRLQGFSLMAHGLEAETSLRLLRAGLGSARQFGCGIFVQHKSAAAVGD